MVRLLFYIDLGLFTVDMCGMFPALGKRTNFISHLLCPSDYFEYMFRYLYLHIYINTRIGTWPLIGR